MAALRIGGTADHVPTLQEALDLVDGRVPMVVELKGIPGHDDGLVEKRRQAAHALQGQGGDHVVRPLADPRFPETRAAAFPAG